MLRSRSAREKVSPADSRCRTWSPSSSETVRARRERHGHHERAGRKVLPGGQDGADQRFGPGDDLGWAADQGQYQQAGVQLVRVVAQLADVPVVEGAPGGIGEHVSAGRRLGQFSAYLLWAPAELAERPVLGFAQRPDPPRPPGQPGPTLSG